MHSLERRIVSYDSIENPSIIVTSAEGIQQELLEACRRIGAENNLYFRCFSYLGSYISLLSSFILEKLFPIACAVSPIVFLPLGIMCAQEAAKTFGWDSNEKWIPVIDTCGQVIGILTYGSISALSFSASKSVGKALNQALKRGIAISDCSLKNLVGGTALVAAAGSSAAPPGIFSERILPPPYNIVFSILSFISTATLNGFSLKILYGQLTDWIRTSLLPRLRNHHEESTVSIPLLSTNNQSLSNNSSSLLIQILIALFSFLPAILYYRLTSDEIRPLLLSLNFPSVLANLLTGIISVLSTAGNGALLTHKTRAAIFEFLSQGFPRGARQRTVKILSMLLASITTSSLLYLIMKYSEDNWIWWWGALGLPSVVLTRESGLYDVMIASADALMVVMIGMHNFICGSDHNESENIFVNQNINSNSQENGNNFNFFPRSPLDCFGGEYCGCGDHNNSGYERIERLSLGI